MEEYALDELAARAEAVLPGLGPLVVRLVRLTMAAGAAPTLDEMEQLVTVAGRELLRGTVQLAPDGQDVNAQDT